MLKKKNRLDSTRIKFVLSKGKRFNFDNFTVRVLQNAETNKFSVTVGKNIAKTAIVRNRLRRQIYEIIRLETPLSPNSQYISIFLKASAVDLSKQQLKADIIHILNTFIKPNK